MEKQKFVTPEVNLLPEDDLEQRPGGKFLKWALSWGKKIVVLTELFVVLAFLSRFKLDSDVANLSEEIDRRKTIITASKQFENQFRLVQNRVDKVGSIFKLPSAVTIYNLAQSLVPEELTIDKISVVDTKVSLQGSGNDKNLSQLVSSFKSSSNFTDIILEKVTKQGENTSISFSLTATYDTK